MEEVIETKNNSSETVAVVGATVVVSAVATVGVGSILDFLAYLFD